MKQYLSIICFLVALNSFCMQLSDVQDPQKRIFQSLAENIRHGIKTGADLDQPFSPYAPERNNPPIIVAALHGFTGLASLLIKHGVNVNVQQGRGCTPLHFAADHNNRPMLKLLLANKAQTEIKAEALHGFTPLHFAAERGNTTIVVDLLLAHADPNARTTNGDLPLTLALKVSGDDADRRTDQIRKNCMYWLLYCGAIPRLVDLSSELVVTSFGRKHALFPELYNLATGYDQIKSQLFQAVNSKNHAGVRCLARSCTLLVQDANGDCPLHHAVRNNDTKMIVLLLLRNKHLIGVRNNLGHTPVHEAANGRQFFIGRFLVPERYPIYDSWTYYFWRFMHVISCGML